MTAPEEQRQDGHEKSVCAQVGGKGKVGVEEGGAQTGLQGREEGCFCSDEWEEGVS